MSFDDASGFVDMTSSEAVAREDAALLVRFEWVDVEDPEETKKNGYACFRKREFVRILIPGSKEERVTKARPEHKRRFPRAWAAFQAGHGEAINGTPLAECAVLNATERSMLNHHGVVSVEQAAALSDENISNMGHGVRPVRDRVKSWMDARKSHQPIAALQAQLKEKDAAMAAMMERLAALETRDGAPTLAEAPKPKRVRASRAKPKAAQPQE